MRLLAALIFFVGLFLFYGCKKDEEPAQTSPPAQPDTVAVWKQVHSIVSKGSRSYYIKDKNTAWILLGTSSTAQLVSTTDGGKTWSQKDIGIATDLPYDIHFTSLSEGYISLHQRNTHYTNDGGNTWKEISRYTGGLDVYNSKLYVFDAGGRIYRYNATTDTMLLTNDSLKTIAFPKPKIVFGNKRIIPFQTGVIRSDDGGRNWKRQEVPFATISSIALKSTNEWYIIPANKGLFKSTDDGKTWTELNQEYFNYNMQFHNDTLFLNHGGNVSWSVDGKSFTPVSDETRISGHVMSLGQNLICYTQDGIYIRDYKIK